MRSRADAVIAGAGILGAVAALHLAEAGWRVAVLDAGDFAGGTSGATNANLALQNRDPHTPEFALALHTAAMLRDFEARYGWDLELRTAGGISFVERPEDLSRVRGRAEAQRAAGLAAEVVEGADVRRIAPDAAPDLAGGLYAPQSAWINPFHVVEACLARVRARGGTVAFRTPVTAIGVDEGRVTYVEAPSGRIDTPIVIDAAGVAAGAVAALAGVPFRIVPVWGQLVVVEEHGVVGGRVANMNEASLALRGSKAEALRGSTPDDFAVRFLATRLPSGHLLVGRCEIHGEARRRVDPAALRAVARRATRFVPSIASRRVLRVFAGIRPFSPDDRPAVGATPAVRGFALLAGFGDRGVGLCGAAKILAQQLLGEVPDLSLAPYDAARFTA
ncbi:MAG: FAD-dependent oxidoreductase [Armatimonadetes bacterium]|nr:FAD-dependent oxidoreductase [Armatimonadota bacterium]